MKRQWFIGSVLGSFALLFGSALMAGTPASVQSTYRPNGLQLWSNTLGRVQMKKSDSAATTFFNSDMPNFLDLLEDNLGERSALGQVENRSLAPEKLFFYCEYTPRIYFLGEGAGYTNGLGAVICPAKPDTGTVPTGNKFLIIPHSQSSQGLGGSGSGTRSQSEPLLIGDFVDLPTIKRGEQLELFLVANMNSSAVPEATYYNEKAINVDRLQHMVAFFPQNSSYIILGFEDIKGGGDRDYNDLVFAIDVGSCNSLMWQNPNGLPK
jgi:Domain of unknown function (DUF4114)